jgi:anti-sigma regulatory factor (Ser/Thr protein kinase)
MRGRKVLFFDTDPKALRVAERALAATGSDVEIVADEDTLFIKTENDGYDLYMVSVDPPSMANPRWTDWLDRSAPQAKLVLHCTQRTEDYLPLLNKRRYLQNLIAKNETPLEPEELIRTSEKILRKDIFGLEKYLLWGVEPFKIRITSSKEKPAIVRAVSDYARKLGCNERTLEMIETIVDEVVSNAIYNAPRNPDGSAKYAHVDRREVVNLSEAETAELQVGCDGDYLGLAQLDPFGALDQGVVIEYLNRCLVKGPQQVSDKAGGAGIGLYRVFTSLSKFVINLQPKKKTEVITLIDLRLPMKKFKSLPKSFHIFMVE